MEIPIVQPPPRGNQSPIPPRVVLVATGPDLDRLRRRMAVSDERGERLYLSRIYKAPETPAPYALVGPFMGAPQAAMLMETLSAWGATQFLFLGGAAPSPPMSVSAISFCPPGPLSTRALHRVMARRPTRFCCRRWTSTRRSKAPLGRTVWRFTRDLSGPRMPSSRRPPPK